MATEKEYNEASDMVYWLDSKHENYDPSITEGSFQNIGGHKYQILKIKTEPSNGMQAMAIASLDSNGYPDTTQLGWCPGQADSAQEFVDWIELTYPFVRSTCTSN
ncbi:hypothetical protein ACWOC1_03015 [Enterococcus quebecensis]|uniref:Uncharacterized protein n=1 Tax=Enterococcus quebecensis TaxID=903983 RepID=A0A1E5GRC8_9ENTE|nr:hypothetical protein [Enterococcus quebecensis]OEG15247.1 hypothetical protein BCR23_10455 [Enterococcus quebecensis]OJG74829.1 hypothetical protein RV12_GL002246 [Enterococcus quebecensis]